MVVRLSNFGRNLWLAPETIYQPKSEQEVLQLLDRHRGERIRVIGRLHSWSQVIQCDDILLDLRHLDDVEVSAGDAESASHVEPTVQVGAGCQVQRLLDELASHGDLTLPSVGFITEQSVGGAISTGTHGSGRHSLSHYVVAVRLARYDTESQSAVIEKVTEGDLLRAARCSLGSLGIILSVEMRCRAAYRVEEHFHEYTHLRDVLDAEQEYPLQQFYLVPWRWTYVAQHRRETDQPSGKTAWFYRWYRFLVLDLMMHLLILLLVRIVKLPSLVRASYRSLIPKAVIRNVPVVDDSTRQLVMEHELFRHIEFELFVQRPELEPAMSFVTDVLRVCGGTLKRGEPRFESQVKLAGIAADLEALAGTYCHHFPICVRKVLCEETLVSMASPSDRADGDEGGKASEPWYAITLTSYARGNDRTSFEAFAVVLTRGMYQLFQARPHWGKLCSLSAAQLPSLYPRWSEFRRICRAFDPHGQFRNVWTEQLLQEPDGSDAPRQPGPKAK